MHECSTCGFRCNGEDTHKYFHKKELGKYASDCKKCQISKQRKEQAERSKHCRLKPMSNDDIVQWDKEHPIDTNILYNVIAGVRDTSSRSEHVRTTGARHE